MLENLLLKKVKKGGTLAKGKYFQHVAHTKTVSWPDFIRHIQAHGSSYSRGTVSGVMQDMVDCLVEICKDSKKVRLADLGTFYMSVSGDGADKQDDLSVDSVKRVHLRFTPNLGCDYPLDSATLRKSVSMGQSEHILASSATSAGQQQSSGGGTGGDNPVEQGI